jgi:hypothetical protein
VNCDIIDETDSSLGRFYATQAALKAAGNLIGSAVVLGIAAPGKKSGGVPMAVYIIFIVIMVVAMSFALLLCRPADVRRKDGTAIAVFKKETYAVEFKNVAKLVFDLKAMLLVPCLIVAEFQLILQPGISGTCSLFPVWCIS